MQQYGIDNGLFAVKLVNGKVTYVPSRVLSGHYPSLSVLTEENESFLYEINGNKYTVIEKPSANTSHRFLQTRTDDFPYSDITQVLVYHALLKAGATGEVAICTGLPFNQYYSETGVKNTDLISKVKEAFKRTVNVIQPYDNLPIVSEHMVCSEGVAGYFDLKFNQDGSINEEFTNLQQNGVVSVVDIGGSTTDIVTFDGDSLDFSRSSTIDIGGLWLKDQVAAHVKVKMGASGLPDKMIDEIIVNNGLYPAKNLDFSEILNTLKLELANEITNQVKHKIRNTSDINLIAFIGGGSLTLKEQLKSLYSPQIARFVKDPINANARGMLKLLKYL